MGVKTTITLDELNALFKTYDFISIKATTNGVIDTTYLVYTRESGYILKKYERDISTKIDEDIRLLNELKSAGLNVPRCIEASGEWYLYEMLSGESPRVIKSYHIQELARFLSNFHKHTYSSCLQKAFIDEHDIYDDMAYAKKSFYYHFKRVEFLKVHKSRNDGKIHADIFKDNTVFDGKKIGVFDFIDSVDGSFVFDVAVALVAFDSFKHGEYFINLFINTYNQKAPKKLNKKELLANMRVARALYSVKRIGMYKNVKKANELLRELR